MLRIFILYAVCVTATFVGALNANATTVPITNSEIIETTFVPSGDAKLFCRSLGKGKPVIVIHGGPGLTQDYFLPQMYELAKHNLVIFYDQRGCGESTGAINADTITLDTFLDDIEAIRQSLKVDRISVLGHSWGGFLAMQYVIKYQEHVEKLILSNSAPSNSEGFALFLQEYLKRLSPFQAQLDEISHSKGFQDGDPLVMEQFYRLVFSQYCFNPEKVELLNLRMTSKALLNGRKVSEIFRENVLTKPFNLNKSLNTLKIPTLIVHGDADAVPSSTAQNIHENIPGSKYVLMKNCGHFPYVEDPTNYFNHIDDFLNAK
jgi:proline iminopeptidase